MGPDYFGRVFADRVSGTELEGFLSGDDVLVPVPRASPMKEGTVWPARRIAEALCRQGHGVEVRGLLQRREAVPSSSRDRGERLARVHEESVAVDADQALYPPGRSVVLVDDVVGSGATALGMARRLLRVWPDLPIRLLAAARTVTWRGEGAVPATLDPVVGWIRERSPDRPPQRRP